MQKLLCATGNKVKFDIGRKLLEQYDIELEQVVVEIDEIQGEDAEVIIRDKVAKAFAAVQRPVVVTDDSWTIPGLRGFPGPYMKSITHWFTPEDFVRLTSTLADRRIFLNRFIAYQDEQQVVVFREDIAGELQKQAQGKGNYGQSLMKVVSLEGDNGLTVSEIYDAGKEHDSERLHRLGRDWQEFGTWYKEHVLG